MEIIKILGIGLISLILIIVIKQYKPEFAIYISLISGTLILMMVFTKLTEVIGLLSSYGSRLSVNGKFIILLVKITGIAVLTEFAVSICKDSGESSIANKVDIAGKAIIISISIPIISSLLETILKILP